MRATTTIHKYERGMNEYLDKILEEGMTVWIINGSTGRRPVIADTQEEAEAQYVEKY